MQIDIVATWANKVILCDYARVALMILLMMLPYMSHYSHYRYVEIQWQVKSARSVLFCVCGGVNYNTLYVCNQYSTGRIVFMKFNIL